MKKVIRLTEADLTRIVRRVISEQMTTNSKECLINAGFERGTMGGPATRRVIYEKKFQGSTYQIGIEGTETPKKELRIVKSGGGTMVCSSWSCDSSKPLGISYSGCVAKQQPYM
jgi:hypothetical protein